jgi:hypothetical protein
VSTFPVFELHGDPIERGRSHGRQLRAEIGACIDIYRLAIGLPDDQLLAAGLRGAANVERFSPSIAAEISAIADGAGLDHRWIHVLNARSELMSAAGDGCTSIFVPDLGLLGQSWDWIEPLEDLAFVATVAPDDGPAFATLTEPGIVAKIGVNDAGRHREISVLDGAPVVRTNHLPGRAETAGRLVENSSARLDTATALVPSVTDTASLLAVLADRRDPTHPICAPYRPLLGTAVGTVATVVMDLHARLLHVRRGPDPSQPVQRVPIGPTPDASA